MSHTWRAKTHAVATQPLAPYTGEGAYHGSTQQRTAPVAPPPPPPPEMTAYTLDAYAAAGETRIRAFQATFPNRFEICATLPEPSQEAIRADEVTFCWCPFDEALQRAGPQVRRVLAAMAPHLDGTRRHVYVDAKIQHFEAGDLPVDSQAWHVDGSIVARDARAQRLGHRLLHDMKARLDGPARPPICLSYQSSTHCATRFATAPLTLELPELIPDFDLLDARVRAAAPAEIAQPAGSIVRFDGCSLHRAVPAEDAGWRLWVRCFETDRAVHLTTQIIDCYATVFRPSAARIAPG